MNWVLFFYHVAQHSVLNIMLSFFSVSFKIDIGTKNMGWLFEEEEEKKPNLYDGRHLLRGVIFAAIKIK